MKRGFFVVAALAFIAFFIAIIVIANRGEGNDWWFFINRIPFGDKVGHLVLVGTLSFLCNLAIRPRRFCWLPRFITLTTLVLFVVLSLEEIAQMFLPHRTCDLFDWLADLAGLALGQTMALKIHARWFR